MRVAAMRLLRFSTGARGGSGPPTGVVVAVGIALGVVGFALCYSMRGPIGDGAQRSRAAGLASPARSRIVGGYGRDLDITEVVGGRATYALKVGRVRLEHGPLGFLRVGFLQTAILEDVRLTVHLPAGSSGVSSVMGAVESAFIAPLGQPDQNIVTLGPIGGFTGVIASPLEIDVVRDGREILVLGSQRANVNVRRRQLDLEGQVRVSADGGARILESDTLHVSLETQQVWTDGEVHLRTPEGSSQKRGFRGDVFLRTAAVRSAMPGEVASGQEQLLDRAEKERRP
jgi:hypothetical protein